MRALKYDQKVIVSFGRDRFEKAWKNKELNWSILAAKLSESVKTAETHSEYMTMKKSRQDQIKDLGGFVGGHLKEGRRKGENVAARQLLTLDLDFPPKDLPEICEETIKNAYVIYSTHKHCSTKPRYRLIIPVDREMSPEEYEAVARKVAKRVGIDYFDDSTFQPERLMYWPSHSADVDPVYVLQDAPFLSADDVLAEYPDWHDVSYWPMSSRVADLNRKRAEKQGDPLTKTGVLGAFCRAYTMTEAIETFLPEIYTATVKGDRYTYAAGSTFGGLVLYEDKFAYSNHGTDPAGGQLCNAFDLVRIHLYGLLDEDAADKPAGRRPSDLAMRKFAMEDSRVRIMLADERRQQAEEDFRELDEGEDWRDRLTHNENTGRVRPDFENIMLILTFDEQLHSIRLNEMSGKIEAESVPWDRPKGDWRDEDDAHLYAYVSRTYGVEFADNKFSRALTAVADSRRYHPIRTYIDGLPAWDEVERVDTLLIDLLGAEDTVYARDVTRKTLVAAIARIKEPGTKFDHVLTLVGPQGIGKSTIFAKLAGEWFSDALSLTDMRDKTGAELLQGRWIVELGEMAGMKKMDVETVKSFVSRQKDEYRRAYGRSVVSRPRQCIIVGSTNSEEGFLRDITGNRRFWPVAVKGTDGLTPFSLTEDTIAQIWAEALAYYEIGEDLYLTGDALTMAYAKQRASMESDDRQGAVANYLDTLLPENWDGLSLDDRRWFLNHERNGTVRRTSVSRMEIWAECFGNDPSKIEKKDSHAISAIMQKIPGWTDSGSHKRLPLYGKQRLYEMEQRNKGTKIL